MSARHPHRKATGLSLAAEQWRRDNADAIASSNRWVEENGLPLGRFGQHLRRAGEVATDTCHLPHSA
ncbi:type II toxin-antitoxin system CcdA family antitoxin [Pleomorphomonas sp. JP5]|uniref:type II toxin-antitoxin system CcdA family antitoxin n=1 Tax=Pleomorphomonas sp. JP5 TaxID=2942998 RepID=UPI002043DBDE|nr:type II toxin-antitoxin system CcdA family antitoxin [Pleomorphomonas sp. JP5]MCM5557375.1 type II toxin-antitoxin system CcdA family antitoxin [Pleomorphomonas sp. JP5]